MIYVKAVVVQSTWEPSAVGYLRRVADIYECPVYINSFRGHTYVFLATVKTADACSKWVLTGTATHADGLLDRQRFIVDVLLIFAVISN